MQFGISETQRFVKKILTQIVNLNCIIYSFLPFKVLCQMLLHDP